jgi:hypothetical protein
MRIQTASQDDSKFFNLKFLFHGIKNFYTPSSRDQQAVYKVVSSGSATAGVLKGMTSLLTNNALVYEPKCGRGGGGLRGITQ